jgi:hypothetical protein
MEKCMHAHDQNSIVDANSAKRAAQRIKERMAELGYEIPLSHAYQILAANYGYPNWQTMKALLEGTASSKSAPAEDTGKLVWNNTLETAYTDLCEWIVNFQFTTRVLSKMLEAADVPEDLQAFVELLSAGSLRLVDTEQALTILHEIAVVQR